MQEVITFIDTHRQRFVDELVAWVRIPSISSDPARAGDMNMYAEKRHVKVVRPDGATLREMEIDLTLPDNNYATNIVVLPGDVVYVPARNGKQLEKKTGTSLAITSAITAILLFTRIITGL